MIAGISFLAGWEAETIKPIQLSEEIGASKNTPTMPPVGLLLAMIGDDLSRKRSTVRVWIQEAREM